MDLGKKQEQIFYANWKIIEKAFLSKIIFMQLVSPLIQHVI